MLEFLRKHTVVVMAAIALVFIGLVFLNDGNSASALWGNNPALFEIDGKTYTIKDYNEKYSRDIELLKRLSSLAGPLTQQLPAQTSDPYFSIMLNLLLVRTEADNYGIHPGKEQIDKMIGAIPEFQNENGGFDPERYEQVVSMGGKANKPQNEAALRRLVSDFISLNMLEQIVSGGVNANTAFAKAFYQSINQTMDINTALLSESAFRPKTDPTEEQIQAYHKKFSKNFLSDPMRDITVFTFKPKAEIVTSGASKVPAATLEVLNLVELLWEDITKANANGFEDKINQFVKDQENMLTLEKTVFSDIGRNLSQVPDALKIKLNKATIAGEPPALFQIAQSLVPDIKKREVKNEDGTPVVTEKKEEPAKITRDNISTALVLEDGTVALILASNIRPASELKYEDARSAARAKLIDSLTEENMLKAAGELRQKLIKEAKTPEQFKTIAEAAGAKVQNWPAITDPAQAPDLIQGREIYDSLRKVNDGGISDVIEAPGDGAIVAQLVKRTIVDNPQAAQLEEVGVARINMYTKAGLLLPDWSNYCMKKYNVQVFVREQNASVE